jgi:hypothetical protein
MGGLAEIDFDEIETREEIKEILIKDYLGFNFLRKNYQFFKENQKITTFLCSGRQSDYLNMTDKFKLDRELSNSPVFSLSFSPQEIQKFFNGSKDFWSHVSISPELNHFLMQKAALELSFREKYTLFKKLSIRKFSKIPMEEYEKRTFIERWAAHNYPLTSALKQGKLGKVLERYASEKYLKVMLLLLKRWEENYSLDGNEKVITNVNSALKSINGRFSKAHLKELISRLPYNFQKVRIRNLKHRSILKPLKKA